MDEKMRWGTSDEVGRSLARGRVPPSSPIVLEKGVVPRR